jgi:hypothetical protein
LRPWVHSSALPKRQKEKHKTYRNRDTGKRIGRGDRFGKKKGERN